MLKLTGAVMIILAGSLVGYFKSLKLKTRWESLKKIIYSLHIMENEISYGRSSMDKILEKIRVMNGLGFDVENKKSSEDAFLSAINKDELALSKGDEELMRSFSKTLGKTDARVQLKNIKNTVKSLEIMEKDAKLEYEKYGKMYRNMGMLLGLAAVILLV